MFELSYGNSRKHFGEVFRKLSKQKDSRVVEGHLMSDHVHRVISFRQIAVSIS